MMKAVFPDAPAGSGLRLQSVEIPRPGAGEVLISVTASGVNRADLYQRKGSYPVPPGSSPILGLEVAGTVQETGAGATRYRPGDRVMALVPGGGYAEYCVAPEVCTLPVPASLSFEQAAAVPEAYFTFWSSIVQHAGLQPGEVFLVHGGTSGIGTASIPIAKFLGATVLATAGSPEKVKACESLGADRAIEYRSTDFAEAARAFLGGRGVDVILDMVGAAYLKKNLDLLERNGRLVLINSQSGPKGEVDLPSLLRRNLTLTGTVLRPRPLAEKARIANEVEEKLWGPLAEGKLRPLVAEVFPLEKAEEAHALMESSRHIGKIVLSGSRAAAG